MAETWVDRALDRAKDIPVIGRAAEWIADRRETARQGPEVYGDDITDPLTGKEYMIEAAATRGGFAYQVQEYGQDQALHRGMSDRWDSALNEARLWTETNILAESRTEYQIQEMQNRPQDLSAWERPGRVEPPSERRQAGIDAQERPRTLRGEIAYTLQSAAEARSWTKSSWAKTPEDRAEIVAIAKKDIAHARELNNLSREVPTQAVQRHHDVGISR